MSSSNKYMEICRVNHLLPYADQVEPYADIAAMSLLESFRRLVSSSTYLSHRHHLVTSIKNFTEMFGFRFTKQEFIGIVKFGLGIVTCQQTDTLTRAAWDHCVVFMLANAGIHLTREDLQIEWKPFRNAALTTNSNYDLRSCVFDLKSGKPMRKIINCVKRFFPISCIEEIWNSVKGRIYRTLAHGPYEKMFERLMIFTPFYSWTFDEIRRVWLDEIFYIWYKYPRKEVNKEVIQLLGQLAFAYPGRIDWEPHLDRIFNFLVIIFSPETGLTDLDRRVLSGCATIIIYSIVPGSSAIDRLRGLLEVCKCIYHPSTKHKSTPYFLFFCKRLLLSLKQRNEWELNDCPEIASVHGQIVSWAKLTREQVDELVDILLPICLDVNIYTTFSGAGLQSALFSIQSLAALRPRRVLPSILDSLETGFLSPELPLRVTRPLMSLAYSTAYLTVLKSTADWVDFTAIGRQPTDQPHNYADESPRPQTEEQRRYLSSHLSAKSYPEGRTLVARILHCCLAGLDLNNRDRLQHSIFALNTLFLTMPMQDLSDQDVSTLLAKPAMTEEQEKETEEEQSLRCEIQQHFVMSEVAKATADVEDLVVQVYLRLLHFLANENEAVHFKLVANETEQRTGRIETLCRSLGSLAVSLAISASPVPRLRVRLIKILMDAIFETHWSTSNTRLLNAMLFWLISGRRGVNVADISEQTPESDIALFALNLFWPRFLHLFEELSAEHSITHLTKPEPRFLTLLGILPAYLCALVPSHLAAVKTSFIYPTINILSHLLTVSIGSGGAFSPSTELAHTASEVASLLVFRLVTFSLNFDHLDFFNSRAHCLPVQSAFLTDPMWSPYVGWREMLGSSYWNLPTSESFAVAEYAIRQLFIPILAKISDVTEELYAYAADDDGTSPPQLPRTSGQPSTSLQRLFLISLTTWMYNMANGMFEALKPRPIAHGDAEYVRKVCTELEVMRADVMSAPLSSTGANIRVNIPLFDVPAELDGACLREQIFSVGLRFLDVFSKLSAKYDAHITDSSARSNCSSVIGTLCCKESLSNIVDVVSVACINFTSSGEEPMTTRMLSLLETNIGGHNGACFSESSFLSTDVHKICGMFGASRALLAAYAGGEAPSLRFGGGGCLGMSYLPLAWLVCARKNHVFFVCSSLQPAFVWPGSEAIARFTSGRLPANPQSLQFVEVCTRISLTSNKKGVYKLILNIFNSEACYRIPGALCLVARLIVETMKQLCDRDFFIDKDSVYRAQSYCRKRAILILREFIEEVHFINELNLINPHLWAEVWVAFAKSALFTNISSTPSTPNSSILSPTLSQTQLAERYNNQEEICRIFGTAFNSVDTHDFPLYFPTCFDVDAHPRNSPLRRLIVSALNLLKILGGSEIETVKESPPLLVRTMSLRRDAYRFLTQALCNVCIEHTTTTANYNTVMHILSSYPFMSDPSDNSVHDAAIPKEAGGDEFRITAPPPPPPSTALVFKALDFLTCEHTGLASAAATFISSYLRLFLLRSRPLPHVFVSPNAMGLPKPCRDYDPSLMLDPHFDCLSSEANFTLENHIYTLSPPFFYFEPPKTWVDPLYTPVYPIFSGPDDSELVKSDDAKEWLKPRPEMDFSLFSPDDIKELHTGLMAIASHFASHKFWSQFSHRFLYFHRCVDLEMEGNAWSLITSVASSFGPRPFLRLIDNFIISLIRPALLKQTDGVIEFVGPTLATRALDGLVEGSHDWPREARLELFARVLPRLLVALEAASQLASAQPICGSSGEPLSTALNNITFITLPTASGAVGGPFSIDSKTASVSNDEGGTIETSMSDGLVYRILSETWNRRKATYDSNAIDGEMITIDNRDSSGPKLRLPFPSLTFLKQYASNRLQHFVYLPYIWRFFRELALDVNEEGQNKLSVTPELSDLTELPLQHCSHLVPVGYGECPVCYGQRMLPRLDQRLAMFYQISPMIVYTLDWDALHLLDHIHSAVGDVWEILACGASLWARELANAIASVLASAHFDAILKQSPPNLRLYGATTVAHCPPITEHIVSSALESMLISPLAASASARLLNDAAVGQGFVMRRYLPLLVRDSLAVLVLKGIVPSENSFALQTALLANAAEKLTPVTLGLVNCSLRMKQLVLQQIKSRLATIFSILTSVINSAFPTNPIADSMNSSRDAIFLLLAPLFADIVSMSDLFWTASMSEKNGDGKDELSKHIAISFHSFYGSVLSGHTCMKLSLSQADRMLDVMDVFLLHNSWKTRVCGLILLRRLLVCNICSFWSGDARSEGLRERLKCRLSETLADSWIEVARGASKTIAYALQFGILKYEEQWFRQLVKESRRKLGEQIDRGVEENSSALRRRHAGVLGLCAFIEAHEHDTPDYLPEVIAEVAKHTHDPQPIAKSVADTLMAYSRTHHGKWNIDRAKFSEAQLEAYLSVVSSVSYYV